jgi:hypothetical protein
MFTIKNLKAVLLLLCCVTTMAQAQFSKNAIYGNFGGAYGIGSGLHYERIIIGGPFIHINLNAGLGYSLKGIENYENKLIAPVGLGLSLGLRQHFIEGSAGLINHIDAGVADSVDFYALPNLIGANLQLGYKYISKNRPGLFFKVYANANYLAGLPADQQNSSPALERIFTAKMQPGFGFAMGMSF